jgi:hypothetical protein
MDCPAISIYFHRGSPEAESLESADGGLMTETSSQRCSREKFPCKKRIFAILSGSSMEYKESRRDTVSSENDRGAEKILIWNSRTQEKALKKCLM